MITVGIIESNYLLSRNYVEFFEALNDYKIAFRVASFNDLDLTQNLPQFDVIVLSALPEESNDMHIIQYMKKAWPFISVVLFTTSTDVVFIINCLKNGADGYILKTDGLFELHQAIRQTKKDGLVISPVVARLLIRHIFTETTAAFQLNLTVKEKQIIHLVKEGLSYKQMAKELKVTPFTINHHLKKIYKKSDVKSRSQLMVLLQKYAET